MSLSYHIFYIKETKYFQFLPLHSYRQSHTAVNILKICIQRKLTAYAFCLRRKMENAMRQIITDTREPVAVASPIGNNVSGNIFDVRYTPGTRTKTIAVILCMKDNSDLPHAQKYPLKLK